MPALGTPEDSLRKAREFYDFWESFDSWREFVHEDEYDLNQAEGRSERRWMEQENRRMKSTLIKAEKVRIAKLVNFGYENDPRIIAYLNKKEEEKLRRRNDKKNQKDILKMEEQARKNEIIKTAQDKKDQLEMQTKIDSEEKVRKILRKKEVGNEFRDAAKSAITCQKCDNYFLDEVIYKLKEEELLIITLKLKSMEINSLKLLEAEVKFMIELRSRPNAQSNIIQPASKPIQPKLEWTPQEISLLAKGVIKFPPGIIDRWIRVSAYIGGRFTDNECADRAKLLKTQHIKDLIKKEEDASPVLQEDIPKKLEPEPEKIINQIPVVQKAAGLGIWSQEQQSALEVALKKYPVTMPAKLRWEKIASQVDDKSFKDCVERFKYLKEKMKK